MSSFFMCSSARVCVDGHMLRSTVTNMGCMTFKFGKHSTNEWLCTTVAAVHKRFRAAEHAAMSGAQLLLAGRPAAPHGV